MRNNSVGNFNYCPLIWMLSSKATNKEINRTHKSVLWVLHKDNTLSVDKCLMKEAGTKIHVKNLHRLSIQNSLLLKPIIPLGAVYHETS